MMRISGPISRLCVLLAVLAAAASLAGLLWPDGTGPITVQTVRGSSAELSGTGLYRYDTVFTAAGNRGTDLVTLLLGVPLLVFTLVRSRRRAAWAPPVLLGTVGYLLYVYGGYALGAVAYNELFLLYVALFSAALYAFVLLFAALHHHGPARLFRPGTPRGAPAALMVASAGVLLLVWGAPLMSATVTGAAPDRLGPYTVPFTHALDLAVLLPATLWAGTLIVRREPHGYLIACSVLVLEILLAPLIITQTLLQLRAGVAFTVPEIVGPMIGFVVLAVAAVLVLIAVVRQAVTGSTPVPAAPPGSESGGRR